MVLCRLYQKHKYKRLTSSSSLSVDRTFIVDGRLERSVWNFSIYSSSCRYLTQHHLYIVKRIIAIIYNVPFRVQGAYFSIMPSRGCSISYNISIATGRILYCNHRVLHTISNRAFNFRAYHGVSPKGWRDDWAHRVKPLTTKTIGTRFNEYLRWK